jgi:nitrite reductase/ring-hydroxylating ferredoxin subunit
MSFDFGGIIIPMDEFDWIAVFEEDKLRENSVELVSPKGVGVLLIRKGGNEIYAVSNKCAHMACPLRGGDLEGYILKCPCHDWRFDIRTGELLEAKEVRIPVYGCKIEDNRIWVRI